MTEKVDNFFGRVYVDFTKDKALVYPTIIGKSKPQRWSIEQARQYVQYLETEEIEV